MLTQQSQTSTKHMRKNKKSKRTHSRQSISFVKEEKKGSIIAMKTRKKKDDEDAAAAKESHIMLWIYPHLSS